MSIWMRLLWAACVVMVVAALSVESAFAEEFTKIGGFGGAGSGPGQFAGESPGSIAVDDSTGALYVFDSGPNRRVEKFDGTGNFVLQFEAPATPFAKEDAGLAVDNSSGPSKGEVYVVDTGNNIVDKFDAEGRYLGQLTGLSTPSGAAVDSSGNVYVTQLGGTEDVVEFNSEGGFVDEKDIGGLTAPFGIALDSRHRLLYIVNLFNDIVRVDLNSIGEVEPGSEAVFDTGGSTSIGLESSTGRLFVADSEGGSHIVEYEPDGERITEFGAGQIGLSLGLATDPTNKHVYVADLTSDEVGVYAEPPPLGPLPEPVAGAPSELKPKEATFDGTINPHGVSTSYYFEYGLCGKPCAVSGYPLKTSPEGIVGELKEVEPVLLEAVKVAQLQPESTYHVRLVAKNANGVVRGEEVEFTTPAAVKATACEAIGISALSAELRGTINPEGFATNSFFEYGTTVGYGQEAKTFVVGSEPPESQDGSGNAQVEVYALVRGLEPNKVYHCQLVGKNSEGSGVSGDHEFKTLAAAPSVDEPAPAEPVVEVGRTTAVLRGSVNPENSGTKYHFRYGKTAGYGSDSPEADAGEGFGDEVVESGRIEGLQAGTTYHYALVASHASNEGGTVLGPDHTFTTAARSEPVVDAGEASGVTTTVATISAVVGSQGLPTNYEFDLGTDITYTGAKIFGQVVPGHESITLRLEGLAPATTYHWRIVARNEDGSTVGPDEVFATTGVASPIVQPLAPPLLGVPLIAFPKEQGKVIKPRQGRGRRKKGRRHKPNTRSRPGRRRK